MIYLENDFYSNFNSMVNANDEMAIKEMFIDQISSVIAFNREGLLDLFRKVGITTSQKPTNKEITTLIINNIKSNKKLQIGLAYLIAERNNLLQDEIKKQRSDNFDGDKPTKQKKDLKQTADVVSSLANSIQVIANTLNNTNANKLQQSMESQTNSKSPSGEELQEAQLQEQKEAEEKAKKKRRKNILIGLVVVTLIVGGIVAYKKGLFTKKTNV